jgi:hypothetical protein
MKASPVTITQYKSEHWRSDGDLLISTCKEISTELSRPMVMVSLAIQAYSGQCAF